MFISNIKQEEIEKMELASFSGEIHVVDKLDVEYDKAIRYLKNKKIIGFDTETRPCFSPNQPRYGTALLQLSGAEKAFLFRINKIGMKKELCSILSDRRIIKVGAAVDDDIKGLQKHTNFKAKGFIDLQKIVMDYGIKDKSVKKMSAIILGVRISKTQQLSNWEAETLSESQQRYAATDAWICREMYIKLLGSEKHPIKENESIE